MTKTGQPVPLIFITGFLGSGKTTLLNRLLDEAASRGKKIGVIINEWGQVNIDASLIPTRDITIEELNNGQVFCSCLSGNFVEALALFAERDLDLVIVETSGMANPFPLKKLLIELKRLTGLHYDYQGMTALVDPGNFLELAELINAVEEQIIASQRVIINKIDLAEPEMLRRVREKIKQINPTAEIVETSQARVDGFLDAPSLPFGGNAFAMRRVKEPYERPGQYVISTNECLTPEKAEAFIREVLPGALRVKGIIRDQSRGWFYVDGVNDQVQTRALEARASGMESKIVIIPKADGANQETVTAAWNACCGLPCSLSSSATNQGWTP